MKQYDERSRSSHSHHFVVVSIVVFAALAWLCSSTIGYTAQRQERALPPVIQSADARHKSFNKVEGIRLHDDRLPALTSGGKIVRIGTNASCSALLRSLWSNDQWSEVKAANFDPFNTSSKVSLRSCKALYYCARYPFFLMSFVRVAVHRYASPEFRVAHSLAAGLKLRLENRRDSAVLIDIGVNDGLDLASWISIFSPMVRHYILVEPQSRYHAQLRNRLQSLLQLQNGTVNATLITSAIGTEDENTMYVVGDGPSAVGLRASAAAPCVESWRKLLPPIPIASVAVTSIRAIFESKGLTAAKVGFLKVDAEGADATIQ